MTRRLGKYGYLCLQFGEYLSRSYRKYFVLHGVSPRLGEFSICLPYVTRWSMDYLRRNVRKFEVVSQRVALFPYFTLFTFTTFHDNPSMGTPVFDIEQSWVVLKRAFSVVVRRLRTRVRPGVSYIWVVENHKSGYPHVHLLVFDRFTEDEILSIRSYWSSVAGIGSFDEGVNVEYSGYGQSYTASKYLVKYMNKQFMRIKEKGVGSFSSPEYVFNAIAWKYKYRLFGMSRDLSAVSRISVFSSDNVDVEWTRLLLHSVDDDVSYVIFDKVGGLNG